MIFGKPLNLVVSRIVLNAVGKREWVRKISRKREGDFDTGPVFETHAKPLSDGRVFRYTDSKRN